MKKAADSESASKPEEDNPFSTRSRLQRSPPTAQATASALATRSRSASAAQRGGIRPPAPQLQSPSPVAPGLPATPSARGGQRGNTRSVSTGAVHRRQPPGAQRQLLAAASAAQEKENDSSSSSYDSYGSRESLTAGKGEPEKPPGILKTAAAAMANRGGGGGGAAGAHGHQPIDVDNLALAFGNQIGVQMNRMGDQIADAMQNIANLAAAAAPPAAAPPPPAAGAPLQLLHRHQAATWRGTSSAPGSTTR
jgi:hypothetical protein